MSGLSFRTALSALNSAQQALQTIGHNIANAATPGYSRQVVRLNTNMPVAGPGGRILGSGVHIGSLDRVVDSLLEARLRSQRSELGRQGALKDNLYELESIFGEPGDSGLSASMSSFFAEISALASSPDSMAARTGLMQKGLLLSDTFNGLRTQMNGILQNIDSQVQSVVDSINEHTEALEAVNRELSRASHRHGPPPDLLDRQEQLLSSLGELVDIRAERNSRGLATVTSGGTLLLSPVGSVEIEMEASGRVGTPPDVRAEGASQGMTPQAGRLAALLEIASTSVEDRIQAIDDLATNMILEMNRVHSTGMPLGGGFTSLTSTNLLADVDGDGSFLDEQVGNANLPFTIENGRLVVNVTDDATGDVTRSIIDVNATMTSVGDLLGALNGISDITASVDATGRLHIAAAGGHRFDFSNRVLPAGDQGNTFGSEQATIVGASGPYNLLAGSSFQVQVQGGAPQTVTFNAGQFANMAQATAAEVAAAINGQVTGATAEVVQGRIVVRDNGSGTSSSIQLTDGASSPLSALGLSTALDTGSDNSVDIALSGSYAGAEDMHLTFRAVGDGQIGSGNLSVEVINQSGGVVATLDVGAGYEIGKSLALVEGVEISFGAGSISETAGDAFAADFVADSDTADVLVAFGLAGFFEGSDAATISVSSSIQDDPRLLAAGLSPAPANNANLLRMLDVQNTQAAGLDGLSLQAFYERIITGIGVDSSRAQSTFETQMIVMEALEAQRDSISGVNIDEELLAMEQFQQAYQVAARFLQTMQDINDTLVDLVR